MKRYVLPLLLAFAAPSALALEIGGVPRVTDGDTLKIGTRTIRLHGIDAFENGQDCERRARSYNCGADATNALRKLAREGLRCVGDGFDDYDRLIAVCHAGSRNINAALVESGHALAFRRYSLDYVTEEERAQKNRAGAWAGTFTPPWEFRNARWATAGNSAPDPACPIKGNISRKGARIYHAPWSRSYKRTKISLEKGERWFCDEAEARAAGWRPPRR